MQMHEMQLDHDSDIAPTGIIPLIVQFGKIVLIAPFGKMIFIAQFEKMILIAQCAQFHYKKARLIAAVLSIVCGGV